MACRYTYQGKTYEAHEFDDVLRSMAPEVAAKYIPGIASVPSAPFVTDTKAWTALALKRMIRYAAENGFDRIAWTNGEQQAARYDLSKQIKHINYQPDGDKFKVMAVAHGGQVALDQKITAAELPDIVGKEVAQKIIDGAGDRGISQIWPDQKGPYKRLSGLDLKVGGEGMKGFYDQIVPQVANDVLKKLGGGKVDERGVSMGADVGTQRWTVQFEDGTTHNSSWPDRRIAESIAKPEYGDKVVQDGETGLKQPGFDITPALRENVLAGLPMFSRGDAGDGGYYYSAGELKRQAEAMLNGAKNAPEIRVVEKPDAFPFPAPEDAKGAYFRGAIWIARANISSPVDLRYVVAHEVIGHYGLRGFFGPLLDSALSFIHAHNPLIRDFTAKWASNNKDVIREYKNDYGMSDEDIWYLSIEEAMAKLSEKLVNFKGLRRLAALVQQALRAMGQSEWADKLEAKTNAEALDMLRKAGLFVKSGQRYDSKKVAPLFSRLADQTLAKDLEDQEKFLNKEARARGYKSIDDLAEKAYPVFEKLAAKWRQQHPVEAALFSRGRLPVEREESQALNNQDAGAVSLRADESGSPAEPAQSGGGAGSDANVPRFSRSAPPAPTSAGSQTPQARIKQWKATANSAIERMDNAVNGMGKMPDQARYLAERYLTLGRIAHIDEIAGNIRDSFSSATPADKKAIYDYLTTRGAASATIQNVGVRDQAEKTKKYIGTVGDQLVKRGLIPQESREEYRDRYLPRLYLAHLLDDSSWRAIGGGKKASDMGYLKQRNDDLPEEYRKVILGEVTDPAFLAASAIAQPMRDMAILDWLGKIVGNENWVWPKQLIEWGGRKVSAHWLQAEADSLLKRAALYESDTDRKKAEVVATEMRKKALATMADMPREHADYKRIPDTPRYGQLRGLMVRREIYDDLVGLGTGVPGDAGFAEQLLGQGGIGSKATKLWKTAKVALNPPGQIRNFISNAVMLQLSGVPLRKIPGLIVRAAKQVKHGGKHWQAAKKYGVTAATFTAQELYRSKRDMLDLEVQMKGHHPLIAIKMVASWVMDKAGDAYQFSEALMKTAKMIDAMEREGMTDEQAALEAQKWLFDYSLVNRNIRYLRNAPVGMPFLTYSAKVAPRLSEVAAKHPLRFLPWVALFYGMGAAAMAMLGGDGDDWDDLKKSLPEWLRKKPHAVPLPWRDSEGRIQFTDIGYFFPWSQWAELGKDLAHGEPMDALRSAGIIGGPVPDIITAIKTGIDPFTKKPIADPADPTWQQSVAVMNYVWSMAAPPFLTSNGFLSPMGLFDKQYGGKLVQGVTGTTDKWGDPRATTEQAFIGLAGVNINGVDPDHTRASELQRLNREALDVKAKLVRRLADRSLSEAQRAILISDYTMEMQERTKKAQEFGNSAKVPAFSRPIGGANAR